LDPHAGRAAKAAPITIIHSDAKRRQSNGNVIILRRFAPEDTTVGMRRFRGLPKLVCSVLVLFINEWLSVEAVGKGWRGGKREAFSTESRPVRRRRIAHNSTDTVFAVLSIVRDDSGKKCEVREPVAIMTDLALI
jgi:hypothetical protein